jgi:glutamate-1-semialdehyde 2,1-aminomutase
MSAAEEFARSFVDTYVQRTPASRALYDRAQAVLPGGDTRTGTFFLPYPTFMERGEGTEVVDVDGNRYTDFLGNFTSLIHGHADPRVVAAIAEQAQHGTAMSFPVEGQVLLAELITARVPAIERMRFCNSGTEAVMNAIRCARAFTGRRSIVKIEGGYNGAYDSAQISVAPGTQAPAWPTGLPDGPGVSPGIVGEVLVAPFNDIETITWILKRYARDVAAVLVEPMVTAAGMLVPDEGYLQGVIDAAHAVGALVILDEIVTFRLSMGGMQELVGIRPDLVTLAKIIGGGLPVGAFGGRADVMATLDPRRAGSIAHSGTFNGNATTMAAGLAAMQGLGPDEFDRLSALGERLRAGLQDAFTQRQLLASVQGMGSLAHIHYCGGPVRNYRDALRSPARCGRLMHMGLFTQGYVIATRGMMAVNTAMTEADVDGLCAAVGSVLDTCHDAFPRIGLPALAST